MRRRTALAAIFGSALLAGCAGAASPAVQSPTQVALEPAAVVKAALTKTNAAGTAVLHMTMNMSVAGKSIAMSMTGPMDMAGGAGDVTTSITGPGTSLTMHEIMVGKVVYLKIQAAGVPNTWFKVDVSKFSAALGSALGGAHAGDQLQQIRSMANVKSVGSDTVNGVAATHYSGQVDLAKVSAALATLTGNAALSKAIGGTTIPVDVWIDGAGRVIQLGENFTLTIEGQPMTANLKLSLSDFGAALHVVAPPNAQDIGSMLGGALGAG